MSEKDIPHPNEVRYEKDGIVYVDLCRRSRKIRTISDHASNGRMFNNKNKKQ